MTRLVQLRSPLTRYVALVDEPCLRLVDGATSVYELAQEAADAAVPLTTLVHDRASDRCLDYDPIYDGRSDWHLLPPIDHPDEPARCLVSGTGLTHPGSAAIGVAPEWFYKGNGTILRAHGEPLVRPAFAEDGGEEAEVAGVYLIGPDGRPRRVGMCAGNEFSDHRFERCSHLNLAGSKLRTCALGPELVVDPTFGSVAGTVTIERGATVLWSRPITTGEAEMCHGLENLAHHRFTFDPDRQPGDVHVHYFGACSLSFGDGVHLADGDVMRVDFDGFGRPLRNPLRVDRTPNALVTVTPLA